MIPFRRNENRRCVPDKPIKIHTPRVRTGPVLCSRSRCSTPAAKVTSILQWISFFIGIAVVARGLVGFINGLLLKPDGPDHGSHGKGDNRRV